MDRDGNDATNDLSYIMIEASKETMLPNFTLSLRVHENTPPDLMQKAIELIKTGIGMPTIVSDKEYIRFFVEHGMSVEDARNYALSGCLDGNIAGKTRIVGGGFINNLKLFDIFLHNGFSVLEGKMAGIETGDPRDFKTFEEFKAAFYKQHEYLIARIGDVCNVQISANRKYNMDPFLSALLEGCLEDGKELSNRKFEPFDNFTMFSSCGAMNVADSMTAIRKLIYEDKKYTMDQLLDAIDHNWEGYEQMQRDFKKAPKYGNNDDYADEMVRDYYDKYITDIESCRTPYGHMIGAGISITMHQLCARTTKASPDGRKDFEVLADGSTSPIHGCDHNGPLAVFSSAMKINQHRYNATLLNMKFHPTALKTESDTMKLAAATKAYLTHGGKQVQYNVVSREILLDAQKNPEQHKDLIVRVAGYSAYFTNLSPMIQNEVIERTSHSM